MQDLGKDVKISMVSGISAAAATPIDTASVDMQGFAGVIFIVLGGPIPAATALVANLQSSSDDGAADAFASISGAQGLSAGETFSETILVMEAANPTERYQRLNILRAGGSIAIGGVLAIQYGPVKSPTVHSAEIIEHILAVGR